MKITKWKAFTILLVIITIIVVYPKVDNYLYRVEIEKQNTETINLIDEDEIIIKREIEEEEIIEEAVIEEAIIKEEIIEEAVIEEEIVKEEIVEEEIEIGRAHV